MFIGRNITVTTTRSTLRDLLIAAGIASPPEVAMDIRLDPDGALTNPIFVGDSTVTSTNYAIRLPSLTPSVVTFGGGADNMRLNQICLVTTGGNSTIHVALSD